MALLLMSLAYPAVEPAPNAPTPPPPPLPPVPLPSAGSMHWQPQHLQPSLLHSALRASPQAPTVPEQPSAAKQEQQQHPSPSRHPHAATQFWQATASEAATMSDAPAAQASSGMGLEGSAPYWQDEQVEREVHTEGAPTGRGAHEALPMAPTQRDGEEVPSHQVHVGSPPAPCVALQCQSHSPPFVWEKCWHSVTVVLKGGAPFAAMPSSAAIMAQ